MSDFSILSQSFVSGIVGGMITSEIYGGDFASNFAHGFVSSYIDYSHNALEGAFDTDISLVEAIELTMDFVPVVSNLKAAYEFSTGETIFGGVELSDLDRNLTGATILLGPVGKAAAKAGKVAYKAAQHTDEAVDMLSSSSNVHDAANATEVALGGAGGVANSAEAAADAALAAGKKSGAAAELRVGDKVYTGVSGEVVEPNSQVTGALMGTPASARKPWHGGCAEIACLDKALNDGVDVSGGTMRAVNIGVSGNGHGTAKKICTSCNDVLNHLEVNKQ